LNDASDFGGNFNASGRSGNSVNFRDVQESLSTFFGDNTYSVLKWIADLDEMAEVLAWSDLELLTYGKKLLTGTAQLFIRSETGIRSWGILKRLLMYEFGNRLTSADVHRKLSVRTKKSDETFHQYLLTMKEIGMHGNIEEDAIIVYIIASIPDSEVNKVILYY